MVWLILISGFFFGFFLQYSRVNRNDVIVGLAMLKDWTVPKTIAVAIGVGAILVNTEIAFGLADYHIKPVMLGGLIVGGVLFGIGMAVLGYCPGTLIVSSGQGSVDAWLGVIGGLAGGLAFTALKPSLGWLLGPDSGKIALFGPTQEWGALQFLSVFAIGAAIIVVAFFLHRRDGDTSFRWLAGGIGIGMLNGLLFLTTTAGRPIGASTAFPYVADRLAGLTGGAYFEQIRGSGHWEMIFLGGALVAALIFAVAGGEFKLTLIHDQWRTVHGDSTTRRVGWALIGGFMLIFGARMAGGCTSGLILSGMTQFALSAVIFSAAMFTTFFLTGWVFYSRSFAKEG